METQVRPIEISLELRTQIREYLEQQGYDVTEGTRLLGKSGIEHTFDMLARRDDGFTSYNVAIGIATGGDRETEAGSIFSLANKAYDCGILDRILLAIPELGQEMKQLARKQRIKVIDGERTGQLFSLKPRPPVRPEEPVRFGTKADLVKSLADRGYGVKEKARVKGRSGIEYTFDILARSQDDQGEQRAAINFPHG